MRQHSIFALLLMIALLGSCGGGPSAGHDPQPAAVPTASSMPPLGLFALKASNGSYVSCAMVTDTAGHIGLYANRPTVGPNEVFTAWYGDDGRFGFKAANDKFIAADRLQSGLLVADREYVGEWETFEVIDKGNGLFGLKNSNGQFVGPHYELPGARTDMLIADKAEANEWERFTIVRDPAIGQ